MISFRWNEQKKISYHRLLSKFDMSSSEQTAFGIKSDYSIYDSDSSIQEAYDLLVSKKQYVEQAFSDFLFEGFDAKMTADNKELIIQWRDKTMQLRYGFQNVLKNYAERNENRLTTLLGD